MKTFALISGGKDSCHNLLHCVANGHQVVALANLAPPESIDELDSMMYQTVGHEGIELLAAALDKPLYREAIVGACVSDTKTYHRAERDEVEDMDRLFQRVIRSHPDVEAVSVGAILSDYQRTRVEQVAARHGITVLSYLWQRDQAELLAEMVASGLEAIVIKVAAMGLMPRKHLGQTLGMLSPTLHKLHDLYEVHVCGEGGEYETFVLDSPLFTRRLVVEESTTIIHSDDAFAPVGYLQLQRLALVDKPGHVVPDADAARTLLADAGFENPVPTIAPTVPEPPASACLTAVPLAPLDATTLEQESSTSSAELDNASASPTSTEPWSICVDGGALADPQEAMQSALSHLRAVLEARGSSLSAICHVQLNVRDMTKFAAINSVYLQAFDVEPPSRVCIQAYQASAVQLLATVEPVARSTLHVRGLSYWAPANIGPYSQSCEHNGTVEMAGQIGLNPASLQLYPSAFAQSSAALQHVQHVRACMGVAGAPAVESLCFVDEANLPEALRESWRSAQEHNLPVHAFAAVPGLPKSAQLEYHYTFHRDAHALPCSADESVQLHQSGPSGVVFAAITVPGTNADQCLAQLETALNHVSDVAGRSLLQARVCVASPEPTWRHRVQNLLAVRFAGPPALITCTGGIWDAQLRPAACFLQLRLAVPRTTLSSGSSSPEP